MPAIETIQLRRGTAAAWVSANPTLAAGEEGFETDTGLRKVGDGVTAWNAPLAYNPVTTGTGATVRANSPTMTGSPAAPTASINNNSTLIATTAYTDRQAASGTKTQTNTTFDTAGTGNSFSVNGVAVTANTGTGAVVRDTSPTLVTPVLGTPTSGTLTNCTSATTNPGTNSTALATTAFVQSAFAAPAFPVPTVNTTIINDPVLYYTCDTAQTSGTTIIDLGSGGHNGTTSGSPGSTTGWYKQAITFNGSNQRITAASNLGIAGDVAFAARVMIADATLTNRTVMCIGRAAAGTRNDLYVDISSGKVNVFCFHAGSFSAVSSSTLLTASIWYEIVVNFTASSGAVTIYIDGVLDTSGTVTSAFPSGTDTFCVGAFVDNGSFVNFFSGSLDEVRVYNRVLSATEILALTNFGTTGLNGAVVLANATLNTRNGLIVGVLPSSQTSVSHLVGIGSAPTIAAGAGAGTAPTISLVGTDLGGRITLTSGALPSAASVIFTVTFSMAYASAPYVTFSAGNPNAAALSGLTAIYADSTATTFVFDSGATGITAALQFVWNYSVTG